MFENPKIPEDPLFLRKDFRRLKMYWLRGSWCLRSVMTTELVRCTSK